MKFWFTASRRRGGFVLIEALVALLLISLGLVAVAGLQSRSVSSAGIAKARSEAAAMSQQKIEQLRNIVLRAGFTGTPLLTGTSTVLGTNATYAMSWTVTTPNTGLEQRLVQVSTTWTDSSNATQRLDLNSLVAWDDPGAQSKLNAPKGAALISPTGNALRGSGQFTSSTGTANPDGSRLYTDASNTRYLLKSDGSVLLYLPPVGNQAQNFTSITGRIFLDQSVSASQLPSSSDVRVRLSSEGECIYDNSPANLTTTSGNGFKYFTYTCYVGPGWYGNVGVTVDGNGSGPTICVGDPKFNTGVSDSTLISSHPVESTTRTYRGFRGTTGAYFSTGVEGGRKYGLSQSTGVSGQVAPFDGKPVPSAYPSFYSVAAGSALDYFDQDFLITKVSGNNSCYSKMGGSAGTIFTRNAGQYVCINPDNYTGASDVCPSIWPGFEGAVGNGGSINYTLTVSPAGSGSGTVTSSPTGISCGSACSASFATGTSVTLVAVPASGSSFVSWAGCTSTSGTSCSVTLSGATTVTPTFSTSASYQLTVAKTGSDAAAGSVTSGDALINCGSTCSASYASGSSVVLTAVAGGSGAFSGWTGCTLVTGNVCTVAVTGAASVSASFTAAASYALSVTKAGTGVGTVSSSPSGVSCGSTCTANYAVNSSVTLGAVASPGSNFTGWSGGGCSGTGSCVVTMTAAKSVTATFALNASCATPVSGTAADKNGTVTASGNTSGSCAMAGGNSSNYSCTLTAPSGTIITLSNVKTNGNPVFSYSQSITANCVAQTNVNFPP